MSRQFKKEKIGKTDDTIGVFGALAIFIIIGFVVVVFCFVFMAMFPLLGGAL